MGGVGGGGEWTQAGPNRVKRQDFGLDHRCGADFFRQVLEHKVYVNIAAVFA